jgi:hypothetical protein
MELGRAAGGIDLANGDPGGGLLQRAARALAEAVDAGRLGSLKVGRVDGEDALTAHAHLAPAAVALVEAGFAVTPAGLTKRGGR